MHLKIPAIQQQAYLARVCLRIQCIPSATAGGVDCSHLQACTIWVVLNVLMRCGKIVLLPAHAS